MARHVILLNDNAAIREYSERPWKGLDDLQQQFGWWAVANSHPNVWQVQRFFPAEHYPNNEILVPDCRCPTVHPGAMCIQSNGGLPPTYPSDIKERKSSNYATVFFYMMFFYLLSAPQQWTGVISNLTDQHLCTPKQSKWWLKTLTFPSEPAFCWTVIKAAAWASHPCTSTDHNSATSSCYFIHSSQ